jgi:hypothetical protein
VASGSCHCGAVRYLANGDPVGGSLCHCTDCRRHAGAPTVAWATFPASMVQVIAGSPAVYASSANGRRHFCPACGTGLFFIDAVKSPGNVDVQTATLDDPGAAPPPAHEQVAERIGWMLTAHALPAFPRFPEDGPPGAFSAAKEMG